MKVRDFVVPHEPVDKAEKTEKAETAWCGVCGQETDTWMIRNTCPECDRGVFCVRDRPPSRVDRRIYEIAHAKHLSEEDCIREIGRITYQLGAASFRMESQASLSMLLNDALGEAEKILDEEIPNDVENGPISELPAWLARRIVERLRALYLKEDA